MLILYHGIRAMSTIDATIFVLFSLFVKGERKMYEVFARLIQQRGITPYRVHKDTGVAQSTLSDWKNGKGTPSADKLKKIADYLGVTIEYILTGEDSKSKGKLLVNDDEELTEYLEELKNRPEKRMLFSVTKTATKAQIEAIVKMIEEMQGD